MAQQFVRAAGPDDAEAIARIQVRAWRHGYGDILPGPALEEATGQEAERQWRDNWTEAVTDPPSKRHAVLVATDEGEVRGFAALEPAGDSDCLPATDAELLTLLVDTDAGRHGHGSRLLAASADHLRVHGFVTAVTWVFADDAVSRAFLESAGWGFDGAYRDLDMGTHVRQLRMHTALT